MNDPVLWSLISLQIFMGAFDTLYHHEGTERLAWRSSQKHELRLHGVRNLFYALIFIAFGWFEPHGYFTIGLAAVLLIEILITLWDFVEEDMTRKLPATERINHTLLALNYGAILALAAPVLYDWALLESDILPVSYGLWSWLALVSAFAVAVFGIRDLLASSRSDRLLPQDAKNLLGDLGATKNILIIGGTGFIGTRLVEALVAGHHNVTVLTRKKENAEHLAHPLRIVTSLDQVQNDERIDAIINLAGESVAGGIWTKARRERIIGSRLETTQQILNLVKRLEVKPQCMVSGSAIGWYGLHEDEALTETSSPKECFVHEVCRKWEVAARDIEASGVRLVLLRTGLVLGVEGGILAKLLTPFEFALGGVMGTGNQWMSWIALDDMVRIIGLAIKDTELSGAVNCTAPNPVRNGEFTSALGMALNRPVFFKIPAGILALVLGDLARETMLGGQKVIPEKLLKLGFKFQYDHVHDALNAITGAKPRFKNRLSMPGSIDRPQETELH